MTTPCEKLLAEVGGFGYPPNGDTGRLLSMVKVAREARCICGLYEWAESDCPTCVMRAEMDRLAGEMG